MFGLYALGGRRLAWWRHHSRRPPDFDHFGLRNRVQLEIVAHLNKLNDGEFRHCLESIAGQPATDRAEYRPPVYFLVVALCLGAEEAGGIAASISFFMP